MDKETMYKLSNESDNVLRKELEEGNIALYTFKQMFNLGYLSKDRYNRITRNEGLELI